jgi:hypothetical protein
MCDLIFPIPRWRPRPAAPARHVSLSVALAFAFAAFAFAMTAAESSAAAVVLREPTTDLRLNFDVRGASICVILPASARDADACAGFDADAVAAEVGRSPYAPAAAALVRLEGWSFFVSIASPRVSKPPTTAEHIAELVEGAAEGASVDGAVARVRGDAPGSTYDLLNVNGNHVIRSRLEIDVPEGDPRSPMTRSFLYTFIGRYKATLVSFTTDPKHIEALRPIAESVIRTIPVSTTPEKDIGRSRAYLLGKLAGKLLFLVGAAIGIIWLVVWSSRRKPAPPQAGRGGGG